ncbi:energy-coupling factor ABC transporter ATP-binding protein, partial [bacterium]|nr:energy-coupling factor ABC transporter ATP-binding protein [bacterium]
MVDQPLIKAANLVCEHHDGTVALDDVSFEVMPGRSLAVVGPNGAGKSSLLTCLMGFLKYSGEITINGQVLTSTSVPQIRRVMTMVFQDPDDQLFMPTLAEDVAFGPNNLGLSSDQVESRVSKVLDRLNLSELR